MKKNYSKTQHGKSFLSGVQNKLKPKVLAYLMLLVSAGWGTQTTLAQTYCSFNGLSNSEPITSVDFAGKTKTSSASTSSPVYEDFTTTDTFNVTIGNTYLMTLQGNTDGSFTNRLTAFIDWNGDGTFDNTLGGERYEIGSINGSTGTDTIRTSANIAIPLNAIVGTTRMRIVKTFSNPTTDGCTPYLSYGQAEDYTINIAAGVPCSGTPDGGTASAPAGVCPNTSFTISTANATFDIGIEGVWQESTDNGITWTDIAASANKVSYAVAAGITQATDYRYHITCTNGGADAYSTVVSVGTNNPVYSVYDGVSYTEDFESWVDGCSTTDRPSTSWNNTPSSGNNSWRRNDQGTSASWTSTSGGYSPAFSHGAYSARFHSFNSSTGLKGSLDFYVDMSAATGNTRLSFDNINTSGTDIVKVFLSTDGGLSETQLGSNIGQSSNWTNKTLDFTSNSATTIVRIEATSDYGTTDIGIDNFQLTPVPACLNPTASAAINVTTTSADANWTPTTGDFIIEYGPTATFGTPGTDGNAGNVNNTVVTVSNAGTVSLTGLTATTEYSYVVRQDCGVDGYSANSGVIQFTTATPGQIGSGNGTNSYLPVYSLYNYSYSQQLYMSGEVTTALGVAPNTPTQITKLRFNQTTVAPTPANYNNWTIYLGNTNKSAFAGTTDWEPVSNMSQVFSGTVNNTSIGWLEIEFTTPFTWDGNSNLVIAVDENASGYSSTAQWASYNTGSNRGIIYYDDNTNPNPASPPTASYADRKDIPQIQLEGQPLAACSGTPDGGTVTVSSTSGGAGSSYTVSANGYTAELGITYQWQSNTNNAGWVNEGTATNMYVSYSATAPNNIGDVVEWRLVVDCSGDAANSGTASFTVVDVCSWTVHVWSSGYGDVTTWSLKDVSNNEILSGGTYGYTQGFDDTKTAQAASPLTFEISDWGSWADNEAFFTVSNGSQTVVSGQMGAYPQTFSNLFCPTACPLPTVSAATNITEISADANWTPTTGDFIIEYGPTATFGTPGADENAGNANNTVVTASNAGTITLTGLTAGTEYTYAVRQDCSSNSDGFSHSPQVNFITLCDVENIPYIEDFESASAPNLPVCITKENVNGDPRSWTVFDATPPGLPSKAIVYTYNETESADDWFYTRKLNLNDNTTYRLQFKYKASHGPDYVEKLEVKYGTSNNAASMTSAPLFINTNIDSELADTFSLADELFTVPVAGQYFIGFHVFSDADMASLCVDDVSVTIPLICDMPTADVATNITTSAADANWTPTAGDFIIEYGPTATFGTPGADENAGNANNTVVIASNVGTITLTGLTANTEYTYVVRKDCGANGYSANSSTIIFTTESLPCSGTPDAGTVADITVCENTDFDISSNNATAPVNGLTRQWEYSTDNISWTALSGATGDTYTVSGGISEETYYRYILTCTHDNDAADTTANITVTVNAAPVVTANASNTTICAGDSVELTGGGAVSYTWDNGVNDGDKVAPASSTTYTVTGTDGNNCEATADVTVTVNAAPGVTANASKTTICAGDSVELTGGGAVSYTWDNGVNDGDKVAPTSSTTYTVTGTDGNNCAATADVTVTVNAAPVVTANASNATICAGDSVELTGGGAVSYTWDNGVNDGDKVAPTSSTTYSVTGTDGNNCKATADVTVTVNAVPVVDLGGDIDNCVSPFSYDLDAGNAGASYEWSSGATTQTITVTQNGTYAVTVTQNGCAGSAQIVVNCTTVGIKEIATVNFVLLPNPASAKVSISNDGNLEIQKIEVLNNLGQSVYSQTVGATTTEVDVTQFASGFYIFKIQTEQGVIKKKVDVIR